MNFKDYKINRIHEKGARKRYFVAFYEGEFKDIQREDVFGELEVVNVYQRGAVVKEKNYIFRSNVSDKEVEEFLNKQLLLENGELKAEKPIPQQKIS
jgi:cupin superfamily acireductone dioxygenase involved in methionine salvage